MSGNVPGKIVAFTEAGQAITDISVEQLSGAPRGINCTVHCDDHHTAGLFPPDHKEPDFTFLAVLAADGFLHLVLVGDSVKMMLGLKVGDEVRVKW